ncbi:MAG: phosphopantetheine-binding protein [Caldilineaceae bacterium]
MDITTIIKQEIAFVCAIDPATVREDAWLIEYGLDSVRSMELILALEAHFDLELPDEELGTLTTVGDVVALIQRQNQTSSR